MGQVDDLVVHSKLLASIGDDKDPDASGSTSEGLLDTAPEVTLVNDPQTLLDLTSLGHGDKLAVITDVNEPVLLEDGPEKGVKNNRGGGVRDDTRLLVKLLGEEVDTEVPVLTGLGGGGDADDLAGTVLEDHQIADADVVAGDREGVCLALVNRTDMTLSFESGVVLVAGLIRDGLINREVGRIMVTTSGVGVVTVVVEFGHFVGFVGGGLVVDGRLVGVGEV